MVVFVHRITMPCVVFLRTKSTRDDAYERIFQNQSDFLPCCVPVLSHSFVNKELLLRQLKSIQTDDELIITSQRAVEAVEDALRFLDGISSYSNVYLTFPNIFFFLFQMRAGFMYCKVIVILLVQLPPRLLSKSV